MAKGPTNKTDPDKDDDHKGFGATDVGPGEANRDEEGTTGLTGDSDASIKGSWLTQLIGELTIDGGIGCQVHGLCTGRDALAMSTTLLCKAMHVVKSLSDAGVLYPMCTS